MLNLSYLYALAYCIFLIVANQSRSDVDIPEDKVTFSESERASYEKIFSSILVPFASLTVGEEIGQGV